MATRQQRKDLLKAEDVDQAFDDDTLTWLNDTAKIPAPARERFSDEVRAAVRDYLVEAGRPTLKEIADSIAALGTAVCRALDDRPTAIKAAAAKLDQLLPEARAFLERRGPVHNVLPTSADLLHSEKGSEALKLLFALCGSSAKVKLGRTRSGAKREWQNVTLHSADKDSGPYLQIHEGQKRSRPHLEVQFAGPRIGHRPTDAPKMMLVERLGYAYKQATGKRGRRRKEFLAMVVDVLECLRVNTSPDPDVVRRYDAGRKP